MIDVGLINRCAYALRSMGGQSVCNYRGETIRLRELADELEKGLVDELKDCPFCGGKANYTSNSSNCAVFCECGVSVRYEYGCDKSMVYSIWNRRV